jgi:hypothetical protein
MRTHFRLVSWIFVVFAFGCDGPASDPDAGGEDRDAGSGARDAGMTAEMDAGTDSGPADAGPAEICTPSITGSVPSDEDADDSIDEGCPWHFGPTSELRFSNGPPSFYNLAPKSLSLAAGGRRLYYTVGDWNGSFDNYTVRTASRASREEALVPDANVVVADGSTPRLSVSDDELVAVSLSAHDVLQYRRSSVDEAFGAPSVVGTFDQANDLYMTPDGLEIWFGDIEVVHRARRTSVDESFGPAEALSFEGYTGLAQYPAISPDGRTVFFADYITHQMHYAVRADREALAFGPPTPIDFTATGSATNYRSHMFYNEATQELFAIAGQVSTNSFGVLLRTRVCRDGPCPAFEIPCTGTRTIDGAHCFVHDAAESDWITAESACVALGGHLASGHTYEEAQILAALAGDTPAWIGLDDRGTEGRFQWATGEWSHLIPLYFSYWDEGQPDNDTGVLAEGEDCVVAGVDSNGDGTEVWADDECTNPRPHICETEVWPTW